MTAQRRAHLLALLSVLRSHGLIDRLEVAAPDDRSLHPYHIEAGSGRWDLSLREAELWVAGAMRTYNVLSNRAATVAALIGQEKP